MLLSGLQGQQTLPGLSKAILDFEGLARNPISFHNHICQAGPLKLSVHAGGATDAWLAAAHSACFPASLGCPGCLRSRFLPSPAAWMWCTELRGGSSTWGALRRGKQTQRHCSEIPRALSYPPSKKRVLLSE